MYKNKKRFIEFESIIYNNRCINTEIETSNKNISIDYRENKILILYSIEVNKRVAFSFSLWE